MPATLIETSSLGVLPRILLYCYKPVTVASMYAHTIARVRKPLNSGSQIYVLKNYFKGPANIYQPEIVEDIMVIIITDIMDTMARGRRAILKWMRGVASAFLWYPRATITHAEEYGRISLNGARILLITENRNSDSESGTKLLLSPQKSSRSTSSRINTG